MQIRRKAAKDFRRGFTMLELFIAISIVGVLLAVLLPGVQYAREAARRIACKSNLREISLGLHQFETAQRSFPPSFYGKQDSPGLFRRGSLMGHLAVLPEILGANAVSSTAEKLKFGDAQWWTSPQSEFLRESHNSLFLCPSDGEKGSWVVATITPYYDTYSFHLMPANNDEQWTNYLGCSGSRTYSQSNLKGRGLFLPVSGSRARDILDGLSHTLFVGEVTGQVTDPVRKSGRRNSFSWLAGAQTVGEGLNYDRGKIPGQDFGWIQFRSLHGPMVHFSFVDGRVEAIQENVDQQLLEAMATIADNDMAVTTP